MEREKKKGKVQRAVERATAAKNSTNGCRRE